jgi:hypothetical protein
MIKEDAVAGMALPLGNFETWEQPFDPEYFIYSCAN